MKKAITGGFLLLLLIGFTSIASAPKPKYSSTEGKMSVTFPAGSTFETTESSSEDGKTVKTQSAHNDLVYFVSYTKHTSALEGVDGLTQISVDAFTQALGAEVTEQTDWKVGKNKGIRVLYSAEAAGIEGEYRALIVGQFQYQITVVGSPDSWNQKAADSFFKSFKVGK